MIPGARASPGSSSPASPLRQASPTRSPSREAKARSPSISRSCTSMPTATSSPASRWRERREDRQSEGLVPGAAGLRDRAVLGPAAADDGRELLRAGQLRQQPVLLERDRLVPGAHGPVEPARRAFLRLALAQPPVLGHYPLDRGAARD